MRRYVAAIVVIIVVATVGATVPPADARVHWYVGIGPWWTYPYPYPWYPGPYYTYPPVVIVEPPVYVEAPPPTAYWYYCRPSQTYYPYVETCTEPWITVPATR